MKIYVFALWLIFGLTVLKLAVTALESAYYFYVNGDTKRALYRVWRALVFSVMLAILIGPMIDRFTKEADDEVIEYPKTWQA